MHGLLTKHKYMRLAFLVAIICLIVISIFMVQVDNNGKTKAADYSYQNTPTPRPATFTPTPACPEATAPVVQITVTTSKTAIKVGDTITVSVKPSLVATKFTIVLTGIFTTSQPLTQNGPVSGGNATWQVKAVSAGSATIGANATLTWTNSCSHQVYTHDTSGTSPAITVSGKTPTVTPTFTPTPTTVSIPPWNGNQHAFKVGDLVTFQGHIYKCLQAHTSQPNWTPVNAPALWQFIS